jgi:cytochrome c oxidase subunit 3
LPHPRQRIDGGAEAVSASARQPAPFPPATPAGDHHGSIWPFVAAVGVFLLAASLLATLAWGSWGLVGVLAALTVTVAGTVGWWHQLILEPGAGALKGQAQQDLRTGFGLFIASEVAFFAAFFIGYFYLRGMAPVWPPAGSPGLGPLRLPMLNTIVLAVSGLTLTVGHAALKRYRRQAFLGWLGVTILLGATFLLGQGLEWHESALTLRSGPLGNAFYLLTGFHGLHVLVGTVFLAVVWARGAGGAFTPSQHDAVTLAGWYWHFVDAVWLLLFISFYLL